MDCTLASVYRLTTGNVCALDICRILREDEENMKTHVKETIKEIMESQLTMEQYKMQPNSPNSVEFIDGFLRGLRFSKWRK